MRLLALPSWLDTWGLEYTVVRGFETRGAELFASPLVVLGHHTGTPITPENRHLDLPTLSTLLRGRPDLAGPLCQLGLGRSGHVYCIASGKANHAGRGRWAGLPGGRDYDVRISSRTVGIEAEHPGDSSPWPQAQLDAYDRLAACLLWGLQQEAEAYCGHREWALPEGRKPDPRGIHLPGQRTRIARLLERGPRPTTPATITEDPDMRVVHAPGKPTCLLRADGRLWPLDENTDASAYEAAGVPVKPLSPAQWDSLDEESKRIAAAGL